mgnify:CR=1 FL=1
MTLTKLENMFNREFNTAIENTVKRTDDNGTEILIVIWNNFYGTSHTIAKIKNQYENEENTMIVQPEIENDSIKNMYSDSGYSKTYYAIN